SERDGRGRRKQLLRPRAVPPEWQRMCEYLVAFAQVGHIGADRCDRPGCFRPERHGGRAADLPAADPDEIVPVADTSSGHVDQNLAVGMLRRLVDLEDLDGLAEGCDSGRTHTAPGTLLTRR